MFSVSLSAGIIPVVLVRFKYVSICVSFASAAKPTGPFCGGSCALPPEQPLPRDNHGRFVTNIPSEARTCAVPPPRPFAQCNLILANLRHSQFNIACNASLVVCPRVCTIECTLKNCSVYERKHCLSWRVVAQGCMTLQRPAKKRFECLLVQEASPHVDLTFQLSRQLIPSLSNAFRTHSRANVCSCVPHQLNHVQLHSCHGNGLRWLVCGQWSLAAALSSNALQQTRLVCTDRRAASQCGWWALPLINARAADGGVTSLCQVQRLNILKSFCSRF